MTPAARAKGAVIGLVMLAFGVTMVVVAIRGSGFGGRGGALGEAAPCASAAACEDGCAKGRAADCRQAGLAHHQGVGVERSLARAHRFLRAACDAGDAPGCTALGALVMESGAAIGVAASEAPAILAKACDGGDAMGCNNLASLYADQGPLRDPARARALYEKACDRGSGMACSQIAKAFQAGDGVPADPAQASRFFARARTILQGGCDDGNARACGQAGWLLERDLGGEIDIARARGDYQAGCDGNDGPSCYNLALTRREASADDPNILPLLAKACALGLPEACNATASGTTR
jgi:TPR repeat protein